MKTGKKSEPGALIGKKGETILLEWKTRIKVLNNPELWRNALLGFGVLSIVMGMIFGGIGRTQDGLLIGAGFFAFFLMLFLCIGVVADLAGGFQVTFYLTNRGIRSYSGPRAKKAALLATVGGIFTRSPGTAGAGLLAREEQDVSISWMDVRRIVVRQKSRFILVRRSWVNKPICMYCTDQNFSKVIEILRQRCSSIQVSGVT